MTTEVMRAEVASAEGHELIMGLEADAAVDWSEYAFRVEAEELSGAGKFDKFCFFCYESPRQSLNTSIASSVNKEEEEIRTDVPEICFGSS